jgi:uncharacterized FlaG/YvyC family protein
MKVNALLGSAAYQAAASIGKGREGPVNKPDKAFGPQDPTPVISQQAKTAEESAPSFGMKDADVKRMVEAANQAIAHMNHKVEIERDESTNRFVMRLVDEGGELIRQYPSEEFLAMAERLGQLRGMLFASEG